MSAAAPRPYIALGFPSTPIKYETGRTAADITRGRRDKIRGVLRTFGHIVRHEGGVLALYKGCFANNVRAIASALVLVLYDEIKKYV